MSWPFVRHSIVYGKYGVDRNPGRSGVCQADQGAGYVDRLIEERCLGSGLEALLVPQLEHVKAYFAPWLT